jgi:hypothetical protein
LVCVHVLFMFFVWFFIEREGVGHIKMEGEFLLPEYGVFNPKPYTRPAMCHSVDLQAIIFI